MFKPFFVLLLLLLFSSTIHSAHCDSSDCHDDWDGDLSQSDCCSGGRHCTSGHCCSTSCPHECDPSGLTTECGDSCGSCSGSMCKYDNIDDMFICYDCSGKCGYNAVLGVDCGSCGACQTCSGDSCVPSCTGSCTDTGGAQKCGGASNGCCGTCDSACPPGQTCDTTTKLCVCLPVSCAGKCGSATNGCSTEFCDGCGGTYPPVCNTLTSTCVQCTQNSHCTSPNECNTTSNTCCSGSKPYFTSGACVMCNGDCNCSAGEKCVSNTCVTETCDNTNTRKILNNSQCPTRSCVCPTQYPDLVGGKCMCNQTLLSCGAGKVCVNGDCLPTCEDGTPVYTCNYTIPPKYCSPSGLTDNCTYCNNCGISGSCMTNGSCCNLLYPGDPLKKYWNGTTCTECNKSTHCDAGEQCVAGECKECTPVTSICPTCPSAAQHWNGLACAECIVGFVECVGGKVCSEGRCVDGCSDGGAPVLPGECSEQNGKYCYTNGQFEPKCYINEAMGCPCPPNTNCNEVTGNCDAPVAAAKCSDGTINNTCSQSKPFFCNNLFFESNCMQCGCPDSYTCNIDGTCTMNPQVDEQGNLSLIFENATEGACVEGAMGWKKVDGKLTPDCTTCGCPVSYQCGSNNRCVSLLNLQAPEAPVGVTCPNGQVLNEDFVCVDCKQEDECGINMNCSNGHCCPSYTPTWDGTKCTCASGGEGGCSSIMPWRCNEDGSFLPNCEVCGCPPDYDCRESVCREKPGASLRKVQIPDINPVIALLTLFSFLFFFKKK